MPYALYLNNDIIAFIDMKRGKAVVERKIAAAIEPCLMAYGISVNMGIDETITYHGRLDGFQLRIHNPDITEEKATKAVEICVGFISGKRPEVEVVDEKIYELVPKEKLGGREHETEIEFEKA